MGSGPSSGLYSEDTQRLLHEDAINEAPTHVMLYQLSMTSRRL